MRVPKRKSSENIQKNIDHYITQEKYNELEVELEKLEAKKPAAINEVDRLAAMGDFSENAAYQMAKGRLRRMNYRTLEIKEFLKRAQIISSNENAESIEIGHTVLLETPDQKQLTFQILGSSETNPSKGIISHNSKLGQELLGKKSGDTIVIMTSSKKIIYTIKDFS